MKRIDIAFAWIGVAIFAGCGAGDDGGSSATTVSAPAATSTPVTTAVTPTAVTPAAVQAPDIPPGVPGDLPDGTYTITIEDDDLAAVNTPEHVFEANRGVFTLKFSAGNWQFDQKSGPAPSKPWGDGTYVVDGDAVTFHYLDPDGVLGGGEPFTWSLAGDGALVFVAQPATISEWAAILASRPLERVG